MEEINSEPNPHLNLVLLGKTGAGKSASGNTILGQSAFESKKSCISVTRDAAVESGTVAGIPVTVYDTPGLFDTNKHKHKNKLKQILENVVQKCESGHCVFLLVIKADRFTDEERKTVVKIEKLLGQNRMEKTWILFTRGDELQDENMTIQEFINETKPLKKLVQKYDQRYHVFNNKTKSDQAQLLLVKIIQRLSSDGGSLTRQIPVIRTNDPDEQVTPVSSLPSRQIVLLGKTGAGKSAAGNTILGQKEFRSEMRMISVTTKCSVAHNTVSGITVVDTPGFFDTQMKPEELMIKLAQSVYLSSPGPHAFLIVFPVNNRFTEHEQKIPQQIEMMFGQEVLKYSIILFTHGDQLKGKSVKELIEENSSLRHLVDQCGGRFHVFNNEDVNNREQVNDLLQKIDTMIEQNGGGHYSNKMLEDAQRFRREEEERKREEKERRQKLEEQRQIEEKEGKLQEEKCRQEEIEKVKKETEERIRAEMMEKQIQQEEVKKEADTSNGFKNFLSKHKVHFCLAAVAVGGAALGGAFLGGCFVKYILGGAAAKIIGGAAVGGAVAGGVAGGVAGRAADREVFGGNGIGTVGGAVAGAAFGAFGGYFVGAKLVGEAVSLSVGAVAKAVVNSGVHGGIGGVVGGAAA